MEFYGFSRCGEVFQQLETESGQLASHGRNRIGFDEDIPPFLLRSVKPIVERHVNLVPQWCSELLISWRDEANTDPELGVDRPFECRAITRYRRGVIWIAPPAAGLSQPRRTEALLHEFSHLQLAPIQSHVERLTADDDAARAVLIDKIEQTIESLVKSYLMKDGAGESFMRKFVEGKVAEYDLLDVGAASEPEINDRPPVLSTSGYEQPGSQRDVGSGSTEAAPDTTPTENRNMNVPERLR